MAASSAAYRPTSPRRGGPLSRPRARRTLEANSKSDYRVGLEKELKEIAESEMWVAGAQVRALRPERQGL